jgi:hypothetical protein
LHTGEPVTGVEVRGQKADKSNADHVWITNGRPMRNADGIIIGINVVAEDITERKRADRRCVNSAKRSSSACGPRRTSAFESGMSRRTCW